MTIKVGVHNYYDIQSFSNPMPTRSKLKLHQTFFFLTSSKHMYWLSMCDENRIQRVNQPNTWFRLYETKILSSPPRDTHLQAATLTAPVPVQGAKILQARI